MEQSYNVRCPAVKRLLREAQELHEATEEYFAQPLDDNLFEWHFTVRGPPDTDFDGGVYHGRIVMPPEYPMKPPNIIFLTPNGRFETNKKICLSISGHHPETWQPSWSIRTALLAIIGFMPTPANGTIGSLEYTTKERERLAKKSMEFKCHDCGPISGMLKERTSDNAELQKEARQVSSQVAITAKNESSTEKPKPEDESKAAANAGTQSKADADVGTQSMADADVGTQSKIDADDSTQSKTDCEVGSQEKNSQNVEINPSATIEDNVAMAASVNSNEGVEEVIMEGAPLSRTNSSFSSSSSSTVHQSTHTMAVTTESGSGYVHNFILSAAVFLFVALLLRRLLLLEADASDELEEMLL